MIITDAIGQVIERLRTEPNGPPYYDYGHRLQMANTLKLKETDKVKKAKKYPLFMLRLDTPERHENDMIFYDLNIVILAHTKRDYTTTDRFEEVIKPTLLPLYESFIKELKRSGLFVWGKGIKPPHTMIIRPYYGVLGAEANMANLFGDYVDAIEIQNLKINSYTC